MKIMATEHETEFLKHLLDLNEKYNSQSISKKNIGRYFRTTGLTVTKRDIRYFTTYLEEKRYLEEIGESRHCGKIYKIKIENIKEGLGIKTV